MASTPSRILAQYSLTLSALGKRQPIPMIANGDETWKDAFEVLACFFVTVCVSQLPCFQFPEPQAVQNELPDLKNLRLDCVNY